MADEAIFHVTEAV